MKETFSEYKETIENNLSNFTYLSDGDIISGERMYINKYIINDSISPSFIIKCIDEIYLKSINLMMDKSIPIFIKEDIKHLNKKVLFKYIEDFGFINPIIFLSNNSRFLFTYNQPYNQGPFPIYFYSYNTGPNLNYISPCIKDSVDEIFIFIVDKSIQNLTYSIQNMDYYVRKDGNGYNHILEYDFYNCDFTCYKIICRDIKKMRNDKINKILYGN